MDQGEGVDLQRFRVGELRQEVVENPHVAAADAAVGDDMPALDPLAEGGGLDAHGLGGLGGVHHLAAGHG